jgi:hypothetical protein
MFVKTTEHFAHNSLILLINISKGEFYDLWIHPQKHRKAIV